jgi:sugar lactone lactonase YvrE
MAFVRGIAADAAGNVYVAGTAIIFILDPSDARIRTRIFSFRIWKYSRGPRYPGVTPPDRTMPGANWHRDTTWVVEEGSGIGTLMDPHGIFWSDVGGSGLYASDFGKNWIQKLSDALPSTGFYQLDGGQTGKLLNGPEDVTVDRAGFVYFVDGGNRRVLRYDAHEEFVQKVNVEKDAYGDSLDTPVAVAADDSLAYVADRALGRVIRFQRRK